ncbi:MAG: aldo/keto reductase [Caldilineaceae bacterium]|nr:aldo/keto reductase [Caldilineaceae bacterium]
MEYGSLPGIDKPISRLVQGSVMIGEDKLEESFALLDSIFELGCTTFDTGHVYGNGSVERAFGAWVNDRGIRDKVVVLSKGAHHNRDRQRVNPFDIEADLHDSLARFKFDYADLYLLHRDDPSQPVGPIVETLHKYKEKGWINAYGGSNWSTARIEEANAYAAANGLHPFVASSPNFSLAVQIKPPWENCISVSGPAGESERAWYLKHNMPLFTWSSLAGGFFSGRLNKSNLDSAETYLDKLCVECYASEENLKRLERVQTLAEEKGLSIPQIATAYVMSQPLTIFALVGCRSADEFRANMEAMTLKLSPQEIAWLELKSDER